MRLLVVNADDFGLTEGVNAGIVQAHERGVVSSASLMVRHAAAAAAAAYARSRPELGVGLHVDLRECVPGPDGTWLELYRRCADDAEAVEREVREQLARFRDLVGREPDHIDSHQHVHRLEPVRRVLRQVAAELDVPLRGESPVGYLGGFYGQDGHGQPWLEGISVANLVGLIDALPEGATEFGCHPGLVASDDPLGGTLYRTERNREVETLTDARVRERLARGDVRLVTFPEAMRALAARGASA